MNLGGPLPFSGDDEGRLYGVGPCAQRLLRDLRLVLFGATHVDIAGALYSPLKGLAEAHLNCNQLPGVDEIRNISAKELRRCNSVTRKGIVKRWPLVAINTIVRDFERWIVMQDCNISLLECTFILALAKLIRRTAIQLTERLLPWIRPLISETSKDIPFQLLETYEEAVIGAFLKYLQEVWPCNSIIWLHDGLWIAPAPPSDAVSDTWKKVVNSFQLNMESYALRVKSLTEDRRAIISGLMSVVPLCPPIPLCGLRSTASSSRPCRRSSLLPDLSKIIISRGWSESWDMDVHIQAFFDKKNR